MSERVYLSIPPITLETLDLCRGIRSLCSGMGLETIAPYLSSDYDEPDASRGEAVEAREHPLQRSDIIIAYLGTPSREVFDDMRDAVEKNKPIIVLHEKEKKIEATVLGISGIIEVIEFCNHEDALTQLEIALLNWQWNLVVGYDQSPDPHG